MLKHGDTGSTRHVRSVTWGYAVTQPVQHSSGGPAQHRCSAGGAEACRFHPGWLAGIWGRAGQGEGGRRDRGDSADRTGTGGGVEAGLEWEGREAGQWGTCSQVLSCDMGVRRPPNQLLGSGAEISMDIMRKVMENRKKKKKANDNSKKHSI